MLDLVAIEIGEYRPVVVSQGFGHRQLGLMQQPPQPCLRALLVFLLGQHIQVAGRAPAIGCGLLFGRLPLAADWANFNCFRGEGRALSRAGLLGGSTQEFVMAAQLVFGDVELGKGRQTPRGPQAVVAAQAIETHLAAAQLTPQVALHPGEVVLFGGVWRAPTMTLAALSGGHGPQHWDAAAAAAQQLQGAGLAFLSVIQHFCCRCRSRLLIGAGERRPMACIIWRIEGLWRCWSM